MASDRGLAGHAGLADSQFHALAETAPDAIVTADAANRIAYFNPAAERMFGRPAASALGEPLDVLMPERLRSAHQAGLARYVETGRGPLVGTTVEVVGLDGEGREFPIELSLGSTGAGRERTFTAVIRDVSERKRRERHVAARLAVTRALAASTSAAATAQRIVEDLGRELGCDVGQLWMKGDGRLSVRHVWQADPPATDAFVTTSAGLTFAPGEGLPGAVAADGEPRWVEEMASHPGVIRQAEVRAAGIRSGIWLPLVAEGEVIGVVELLSLELLREDEALRDLLITVAAQVGEHIQRLEAQQARDEARATFANAFRHAPIGMALVDAEGRWTAVNPALSRLTGRSAGELLAQRFEDIAHPDDLEADRALVSRALAGEIDTYELEMRCLKRSGDVLWVRTSASIVRQPGNPYFIVQIQDVSAAREAAELRERTAEALRRSNTELAQFAHVAAHDLRTPLRTISGFADVLLQGEPQGLPAEAQEQVGMIRASADQASDLLDHLLSYALATGGDPERVDLELREVVDDVLRTMHADIAGRDAQVTVGELPRVTADRIQLAQVLQNVLGNAVKFTPADRMPQIGVTARREGDMVCITVADNGVGIDSREADALFTMFRRGSRSGRFSGSGIGLAICAKIVAAHGGRLWVEPNEPEGSRFHLTVPGDDSA